MTSRHKERARHRRRSQLKEEEQLPEGPNYGVRDSAGDPSMTLVELIILWKFGYIRPSASVVSVILFPVLVVIAASVVGIALHNYIFLIPLAVNIAILILVVTPMFLESLRAHLSMGTIASLKERDRGMQINMVLVALAIATVILLFAFIDSGAFEDGARLQITVESVHFSTINYVIYVNSSIVESGTLEPRESTTLNHVYRWASPGPANLTVSVKWSFLSLDFESFAFSSEKVLTVAHGEFYAVGLTI